MRLARPVLFTLLLGWLSGCASTAGAPASATALESERLQRRYAAGELVQLLREEGYGSVEALEEGGVRFKAGGMSYVLTIYDDGDLQLYFGLTGIAVAPEVVNEWNRTRRLTRAYLDTEFDPVLEADLLSDSGISRAMVARWVQVFVQGAGLYHAYLLDHGTVEPVPASVSPNAI